MKFASIVAYEPCRRGFSLDNKIPWKTIKCDMIHFATVTANSIVIMGRKTWETIPNQYLKGRINVVITSNPQCIDNNDIYAFISISNAISFLQSRYSSDMTCFFIGGERIYEESLSMCTDFYISLITGYTGKQCDKFYPKLPDNTTLISKRVFDDVVFCHWKRNT